MCRPEAAPQGHPATRWAPERACHRKLHRLLPAKSGSHHKLPDDEPRRCKFGIVNGLLASLGTSAPAGCSNCSRCLQAFNTTCLCEYRTPAVLRSRVVGQDGGAA